MGALMTRSADYRSMLSLVPHAVALIGAGRRVEYGNRSWAQLIKSGDPIQVTGQRLRFVADTDETTFGRAVDRLLPAEHDPFAARQDAVDRMVWRVGRQGARNDHLVIALAIEPSRSGAMFGEQAKILMIVHSLQTAPLLNPFLLGHAYDLTPAEAQVAVAMAGGARPEDIADRRHVSAQTIRTQVRSVYSKLDVKRQAELVRVLAALPRLDDGLRSTTWSI